MFNDILGTSLGVAKDEGYSAIDKTSFGADSTDKSSFFTGKPYIEDLGYAFLMRNYRSDMGKWLSQDLIGYPDGWNNLAYCNNMSNYAIDLCGTYSWIAETYISDVQGREIFDHWIDGTGTPMIKNKDPSWSDYMRANGLLYAKISAKLRRDSKTRTSSGSIDLTIPMEIEDGYSTGYEFLHGTNRSVGDFNIQGDVIVSDNVISYNVTLTWNDIIDPNLKNGPDWIALILYLLYDSKDYIIRISWEDQFSFKKE